MPIADLCKRNVATLDRKATVADAAKLMRERHVGDVIITDHRSRPTPLGILTDRDIVVGLVAMGIAPETVRVEDVMTPTLVTITEDHGIYETIQMMEHYGVRRLPVIDKNGALIGIVSSADLMELLSHEMVSLSKLTERQKVREREIRI